MPILNGCAPALVGTTKNIKLSSLPVTVRPMQTLRPLHGIPSLGFGLIQNQCRLGSRGTAAKMNPLRRATLQAVRVVVSPTAPSLAAGSIVLLRAARRSTDLPTYGRCQERFLTIFLRCLDWWRSIQRWAEVHVVHLVLFGRNHDALPGCSVHANENSIASRKAKHSRNVAWQSRA